MTMTMMTMTMMTMMMVMMMMTTTMIMITGRNCLGVEHSISPDAVEAHVPIVHL